MMRFELDKEFNKRMKHNFKEYVLLTSKSVNWSEKEILGSIYQLNGYKCHKTVKYGPNTSHLHVKFEKENLAAEAVGVLNRMNSDLRAVLVDDMLRDWFTFEMKASRNPSWSLAIVDIIGHPPFAFNFLTKDILSSTFGNFGKPYLLPYTAALNEPHVQVLFGSMSEAIAACMAFGEWYQHDSRVDAIFYRVRINPSSREAFLIKCSGGTPKEAFKLDYFLSERNEMKRISKTYESDKQSKTSRIKPYPQKIATQKTRKQKHVQISKAESEGKLLNQIPHRPPVVCVPVITRPNTYAEALMSKGGVRRKILNNTVVNLQQTSPIPSTRAIVPSKDSETENRLAIQYPCCEESLESGYAMDLDELDPSSEKQTKDTAESSQEETVNLVPPIQIQNIPEKIPDNYKIPSIVFERSK